MFTVVAVELSDGRCPYRTWLMQQTHTTQVIVDALVSQLLAYEGLNVCKSEFGKSLGKGLYELRARQTPRTIFNRINRDIPLGLKDPDEEVLIRVFFAQQGDHVILLLGGLDKRKANSRRHQDAQISAARKVLSQYKQEIKGRAERSRGGRARG